MFNIKLKMNDLIFEICLFKRIKKFLLFIAKNFVHHIYKQNVYI